MLASSVLSVGLIVAVQDRSLEALNHSLDPSTFGYYPPQRARISSPACQHRVAPQGQAAGSGRNKEQRNACFIRHPATLASRHHQVSGGFGVEYNRL